MKKIVIKGVALFVALFSSSLFALPLKQAKLTVSGYQGGETALENFPLLVRISPERILGFSYGDCASDGSDISFALENGEILPHEIDTWKRDGESLVWVKLPALSGTDTSFYFRWKDSGPAENISANVWSADYAGVWHMNGANGVTPDSTGHGLHAEPKVVPEKAVESKLDTFSIGVSGKVGTARQTATSKKEGNKDCEGGYLQIPNYDHLALGGTFAMSGWLYQTHAFGEPGLIGRKPAYNSTHGWEVELKNYTTAKVRGASDKDNSTNGMTLHTEKETWAHLVFVYNNTTVSVYTNGTFCGSRTIKTPTDNGLPLFLGRRGEEGKTASYIRGYFDEFRLKDGVPSAEWIKAEYDSMESDNFITYAAAEDIAVGSILMISGEPSRIGSPEPAYGTIDSLTPGQSLPLSQPSLEVPGEGTVTNYLKGWTLESLDVGSGEKTLLRSSSNEGEAIDVCNYVHNSSAVMTWLWEARDQLGARDFALVSNGGNHLKFSVDVTGIGYTASSATLKLRYGLTPDNFIWTHVVDQAVEKGGVLEMTLPNTIPGVYYYVKASIETNEAEPQVVETEVIKIQADPSVAGEVSSPLENVVLDASLGNKLTVRGTLASASGGTLTVLVGDSLETITNAWTQLDGSSLSSAGEFSLTLGDAEPGSSRYLSPGSKYYVLVMVETRDGEVFISPAQSVTTPPSTSWTYYETAKDSKGIGYGYITDGVWKLYAERNAKDSLDLYVTASGGEFYGEETNVYPINLTNIYNSDKSEKYTAKKFGNFVHRVSASYLSEYKEQLSEFIAPECVSLDGAGGSNEGHNFWGCTKLTNVVLNAGLAKFPQLAFSGCSSLTDISPRAFPSCENLYGQAFLGCSKLVGKLEFPVCVSVLNDVFSSCLLIEEVSIPSATSIGTAAFKDCASLAKVVVSKDLIQVGSSAFYGCVNLEPDFLQSILTKSIQHIGSTTVAKKEKEFYGCTSLKTLVWNLPNLATNIVSSSCFEGCSSLEKVVFKTPVDEIWGKAFYGIKRGAEIYMHQEVPAIIWRDALSRDKNSPPYTKVYLSDNVDGWLEVLGKYHHVIPKDKFNDSTFSAEAPLMTCGRTAEHRKQSWQTMVNLMAKDTAVCESVKSGNGNNVTSVKMKERGVIAFVLSHNGNHGESCFWVMRAPQKGFSISVR